MAVLRVEKGVPTEGSYIMTRVHATSHSLCFTLYKSLRFLYFLLAFKNTIPPWFEDFWLLVSSSLLSRPSPPKDWGVWNMASLSSMRKIRRICQV